ncbi:hypothetical protein [Cognatilysobacter bugurensis]|uniref:hypothetical protein n=1 Tax=Cognatilysobacter bugurensis TaxID=543356 RepID=UPI003CCE1FDD
MVLVERMDRPRDGFRKPEAPGNVRSTAAAGLDRLLRDFVAVADDVQQRRQPAAPTGVLARLRGDERKVSSGLVPTSLKSRLNTRSSAAYSSQIRAALLLQPRSLSSSA